MWLCQALYPQPLFTGVPRGESPTRSLRAILGHLPYCPCPTRQGLPYPPLATPSSSPFSEATNLPRFSLGITPCSQSPFCFLVSVTLSPVLSPCLSLCACLLLSASLPLSPALRSPSQPPLWPATGTRPSETPPIHTPPHVRTSASGSGGWGARQDKARLRRSASGGPPETAPRLQQGPPDADTSPGFPTRAPAPRPPGHRSPRPLHYAPPLMGVCQRDFPASCFRGHQSQAASPLCRGIDGGREG